MFSELSKTGAKENSDTPGLLGGIYTTPCDRNNLEIKIALNFPGTKLDDSDLTHQNHNEDVLICKILIF
jgi:hypothetical protein